ncbi:MAG: hypothetical protein KAI24_12765, partial [Planctomycetes bacterium]|nr:hypothetical protein [Planctomycetota bacterium]
MPIENGLLRIGSKVAHSGGWRCTEPRTFLVRPGLELAASGGLLSSKSKRAGRAPDEHLLNYDPSNVFARI